MTDLRLTKYFHGIELEKSKKRIFIRQNKYTKELFTIFRIESCKPASTPIAT